MLTIILYIIAVCIIIGFIGFVISLILGTGTLIGYTIYNILYIMRKNLLLSILILLPSFLMILNFNFLGLLGILLYIVIIKAKSKITIQNSIEKYIDEQLAIHRYFSLNSIKYEFINKYDETVYWLYLKLVNSVYIDSLNNALENKMSSNIVYLEDPLDIYIDKNFYLDLQESILEQVDTIILDVLDTKLYTSSDSLKEKTVVNIAGKIPLQSINIELDLFTLINKLYDENRSNITNVINKYDNIIVLKLKELDYYVSVDYKEVLRSNFKKYFESVIVTQIKKYGVMISDFDNFEKYNDIANKFGINELTFKLYYIISKHSNRNSNKSSNSNDVNKILANNNIDKLGKFFVNLEVVKQNFDSLSNNEFGVQTNRDFITYSELKHKFGLETNKDCYHFLNTLKNNTDILASWEVINDTCEFIINKSEIQKYKCNRCSVIDINCHQYDFNIYCDNCFNKIREEEQAETGRKTVKQVSESQIPPHLLARLKAKEANYNENI